MLSFFSLFNVLGMATTEQRIVIYPMVDFLKRGIYFFFEIPTATKF